MSYEILNSRQQRIGKVFATREKAQQSLELRITSPIARTQFWIREISQKEDNRNSAYGNFYV
ncbi:MAG: hypothetical protein IMZ61_03155 [Planctomycetes bacterium]|nr:hypothetical protein [Planctomycetota bacterium]